MVSSFDVDFRQPFNRFKLALPSLVMPDLELNIPWFGIQILDARPSYTPFTVSGINIRGGALDFKPGPVRLSVAGGQVQRAVAGSDTTDVAYRRWLTAGRFGFGKEEQTHLYLHFLKAWDDSASIHPYLGFIVGEDQIDTVELAAPIENSVVSLEGKLSYLDNKLSFEGELAGSAYNRDSRAPIFKNELIDWFPTAIFQPRITTQVDWAARLGSEFSLGSTQFGLEFEQVGWGFESVGVSFLDQDTRTMSVNFSQMFSKPFPISIDLTGEYSQDNLDGMKPVRTNTQTWTMNLGIYPEKFPTFNIGYAPCIRSAPEGPEGLTDEVDDINQTMWASSGYSFNIGERAQNLGISFSLNTTDDRVNSRNDLISWNVGLNGGHEFIEMLSAQWSAGLNRTEGADTSNQFDTGLGVTVSLWENRWRTSLDGFFQTTAGSPENRITLRLNSGLAVFKSFAIDATGQFIYYKAESADEDYTEFLIRSGVSYSW